MAKDFTRITKPGGSNTLSPANNTSGSSGQVSEFVRKKAEQHQKQLQQMQTQQKQDNKAMIISGAQAGNRTPNTGAEAHRAMVRNYSAEYMRRNRPFSVLAEQAEKEYDSYIGSDEYRQKRERYMQEAASRGVEPYQFIGLAFNYVDQTEQELKAKADYYRSQAQQAADRDVTQRNMDEFKTWSPTDQAALMRYVEENNAEPFAGEATFGNSRYNAQELMDKYGSQKVLEMAESYRRAKNEEIADTTAQMAQEKSDGLGGGILHSALSIGANVANALTSPVGYMQELANRTGQYSTLDPNNAGTVFSQYAGNVRQKVAENISGDQYDEYGNQTEEGGLLRQAGATLYEAGMSAADSLARIFAAGGSQAVSLGLAATGSFGQTVSDASKRGANPVQAVAMGIVDGGLEVLTEKVSLDNLFKEAVAGPKGLKDVMKSIFKAGAIEVSEEELSFLGSTFADAAIMQEKSSYNQQVGQLMAQGKSYAQARQEANLNLLMEAVETGVQSFLSGGMMGGGAQVANAWRTRKIGKSFTEMNFDKADIRDLIDSGLESDPGTEFHQIALKLDQEMAAGKTPGNYDLARLWQANEAAIQEEEASREEGAEILEQNAQQSGETSAAAQNAPVVTENGPSVTQPSRNVTQQGQNVINPTQDQSMPVAAQLPQNQTMNGGNIDVTEQRIAGPAAAQPAVAAAVTGAGILSGSSQRYDGQSAPVQTGSMAGRAGQAAQNQALIDQRRATVDRQNRIRSLRLPKISSKELGLPSGTESRNIQLVPQEHYDAEMEQLSQRVYQETGKTVSFVMGRLQIRGADGNVRNINGVVYEDRIVVRADHLRLSMEQIADHEAYHGRVDYFGDSLNQEIRRHIVETYSEEEFRAVLGKYVEALRGVYDVGEIQSGEDYEQLMKQIQEEVFADAYAGINAFGAGADRFTSAVNEKMEQLGTGRFRSQENGVRETNGPPADSVGQKENTAGYGGERYSVEQSGVSNVQTQYSYMKSFADQLVDFQNGTFPQKDMFLLGKTPSVLTKIGMAALPLTMDRTHVDYALNKSYKGNEERVDDHTIPISELARIPELIADPVAVIQDRQIWQKKANEYSVDVLIDMKVNGKNVLAAVNINSRGQINGVEIDTNRIQTLHGNSDTVQRLVNAINEDSEDNAAVYYINKEKANTFLRPAGNPISGAAKELDGFVHSIADPKSPVKMRIASVEESQQFKRWFGDWQNHPENASKVVNDDGTPKVVYHGTNKNFTVFKSKDGCYWFSESEDYAESMAEERGSKTVMQAYLNMRRPYRAKLLPGQFSDPGYEAPIIRAAKAGNYDGVIIEVDTDNELEKDTFYVVFDPTQIKSATDNIGTFDGKNPDIRYSVDEEIDDNDYLSDEEFQKRYGLKLRMVDEEESSADFQTFGENPESKEPRESFSVDEDESDVAEQQVQEPEQKQKKPKRRSIKPVAESRPIIAKKELRNTMMNLFSIPDGSRAELGAMIDGYADRLIKNGALTEVDRKAFFDRMYDAGVMTMPAEDYFAEGRNLLKGGRVYVSESVRKDFGDDWNDIRRRAFGAGIYFTSDRNAGGIDSWNHELAEELPGLFDSEETDLRSILERIVEVAEEGKDEKLSLAEYTARLAEQDFISEREFLDNMERQMDWALRTFAEKARLEVHLRDRTGSRIAKERAEHQEMLQRQKERKELLELQQKTLKTLQWLNKNRNRAPEELRDAFDEVLSDIDIYAVGAANEMRWSDKYNATWQDLAQMVKDASKNDPNFLPSKELERIVARLDGTKIAEMDLGALNDLYKAAVGLRTEFYNRNNVINDETNRLFAEVYTDAKHEIEAAPGGFTGKKLDKLMNLDQLTPMNVLQRMGGWDPDGAFYAMAKQLEKGERDMRAYSVKAQKMLQDFLTEHEDWVKKADGQGKDGIWYDIEIPELIALELGKKPKFGDTIKVSMTPAQKVHMYLESKNTDNLRHMTGGRTFADKKLYSEGKRQEALAQGKTVRLAPETVKAIVKDLTPEEMELARLLEQYYNSFATQEINRVSNILYGYDKAMGKNYAPIYTNRNYTKTEFGVFDQTAEGVGNLKGRQYAVNPSYNISAFDAFEKHVDQTARFVGMAIPSRNWTTLMNWREKNNSTGDVITHKWGEEGKRYIADLLNTLQAGDDAKSDTVSSTVSKLQSTYITAIFGANPSIVLKQLGSIPLASAYLDPQNIPSVQQIRNIDRDLIGKYTQDLAWRTMGYSMPETKQLKENPNWTQTNKFYSFTFGGGAITAMDGWAASVLWPWAENKVRRDFPDLEIGTQEEIQKGESPFYKKVAELFEDALSRSQSTSDEIHQSSLRKSKNPITKAFTMFRSDSAQTYNTLRQKIGEAQYYMRTGATEKVKQKAKQAVGAAFVSLLMNSMWSEAINFLMALWKNKGKNYRDDEEEMTFWSVAGEMASGIVGSFGGIVTGGEEVMEIIGNLLTGEKIYDIETPGIEQLNDLVTAVTDAGGNFREVIAGAVNVAANGGDLGTYFADHSGEMLGSIKDLAETVVMYIPGLPVSGLPVSNLEAYLLGAVKWLSPELGAAYDDLFKNATKSGLSGSEGEVLAAKVERILNSRNISQSEDTAKALAALYEVGYKTAVPSDVPSSISIDGEKHELKPYQQQSYQTVWSSTVSDALDDLVSSESFQEANQETQSKMLSKLYDYAAEQAKGVLFEGYEQESSAQMISKIHEAGLDLAECIAWTSEISGMKQADKLKALRQWNMPDKAKKAIMGTILGTELETEAGNPTQYAQMLDALKQGISVNQYLDMRMKDADIEDYLDYVDSGMEEDLAYALVSRIAEMEDETGEEDLSDLVKWRASVDFSNDVENQLIALHGVMTDSQYQKVEIANSFGVTPRTYVDLQERKVQYDADGNGSYKNAEIQAAIDAMGDKLTVQQKAVLWQLVTGSTSARNNPYSREVGQKVLDAKAAAKEQTDAGEEEETFSDAVMKQLLNRGG